SSSKRSGTGKLWRVALTNAEIADRLESLAGVLERTGSRPYAARAYRRAARAVRSPRAAMRGLVRPDRGGAPLRRPAGGAAGARGMEARPGGRVETGRRAELDEPEGEVSPELVGLGRMLGFGPQLAGEIGRSLGVRTVDEFRAAAADGRLGQVAGIGPKTEAK